MLIWITRIIQVGCELFSRSGWWVAVVVVSGADEVGKLGDVGGLEGRGLLGE